jgi:hypothetical protein
MNSFGPPSGGEWFLVRLVAKTPALAGGWQDDGEVRHGIIEVTV